MEEIALIRLLSTLSKRLCTVHPAALVFCTALAYFGWDVLSTNHQASRDQRALEQELLRRQWTEMEKEAAHRRLMEVLEAMKQRRDLSLPAEPDEGY